MEVICNLNLCTATTTPEVKAYFRVDKINFRTQTIFSSLGIYVKNAFCKKMGKKYWMWPQQWPKQSRVQAPLVVGFLKYLTPDINILALCDLKKAWKFAIHTKRIRLKQKRTVPLIQRTTLHHKGPLWTHCLREKLKALMLCKFWNVQKRSSITLKKNSLELSEWNINAILGKINYKFSGIEIYCVWCKNFFLTILSPIHTFLIK